LIQAVQDLPANPFAGDIEKMEVEGVWRRRVGVYRIFYEIISAQKVIYVFNIKRRTSSTY
jgi:mRNA-degrading endonuclease RelE of RelBE toxin-antitoxin system